MQLNQLKNIHNWIRTSENSEILFVSALIMPLYLLSYNYVLEQIGVGKYQMIILAIALVLYVVGIVWMKNSQSKLESAVNDLLSIKNHLLDKGYQYMSFQRLEEISERFTEDRVRELVVLFPDELRLAKLKKGRTGIKILNIENEG